EVEQPLERGLRPIRVGDLLARQELERSRRRADESIPENHRPPAGAEKERRLAGRFHRRQMNRGKPERQPIIVLEEKVGTMLEKRTVGLVDSDRNFENVLERERGAPVVLVRQKNRLRSATRA